MTSTVAIMPRDGKSTVPDQPFPLRVKSLLMRASSLDHDAQSRAAPRVTVIVCAFTKDRWELLVGALRSLVDQELPPIEVILCIDHNPELYEMSSAEFPVAFSDAPWPLRIVENRFTTRLGGARTTAAEIAVGEILAFLDDDAFAESTWLRRLVEPYRDPAIVAVGGAPLARYESERPRWIPFECNWIFGCAYRGMPKRRAPIEHLIGANMSVRRDVLMSWGGFQSDNHDDMDLSLRAAHEFGAAAVLFEPDAVVHHFVPRSRLTWSYFWRRCYHVNKGKVAAYRGLGPASSLAAEIRFVRRSLSRAILSEGRALASGDLYAPVRYGALVVAIALAGAGAVVGRLR